MSIMKPPFHTELNLGHRLSQGIVGCWLFNEAPPPLGSAMDLSGNGNHGTLVGGAYSVPGKFGPALDFDGTGDYVVAGDVDIVDALTYSIWFNTNIGHATQQVLLRYKDTLLHIGTSNRLYYTPNVGGGGPGPVSYSLNANEWYHIAATQNSSNDWVMYINGTNIGSGSTIALDLISDTNLQIGVLNLGGQWSFDGQIDSVFIYNRALSAGEISDLFRDPFQMFKRNL